MANLDSVQLFDNLYNLIDESFYSLIANDYNSSLTYEVGDYCIYNHYLYKCITVITTPHNFQPNEWQQLNITDCL